MEDILKWYQSHRDLAHVVLATIALIILVIIFESGGKKSSTTSGGKGFKKFVAQVMGFCVVCGIVYGFYWLWATYIKGKHHDLSWLKGVAWGLVAIMPLLLLWRFGFFKWFQGKRKEWKEAKAKADAEAASKSAPDDKKKKTDDKKEKEKESATKKNILTSIWFWIIILTLAVVGFISYWFQKEIEQWIRSGQWQHLPLWIYITGGLALLIMVLWLVGKDRLGKLLALSAMLAGIALFQNTVAGGFRGIIGEHSSTILTTTQLEGVEVLNITPENPVARVYRESWDGIIERTPFDDEVEIYIPPQGARIYDNQGNLIIDKSYTYPLVSKNKGNLSPDQRTGYRFYYSPRNTRAVVHIVPPR